ncbi:MAG: metal ABC transporter permease, partial [Bacteroidota bacterium]
AGIYAAVGLFHFFFRKQFMAISFEPDRAEESGLNVRMWDFFFYMSFGFVITSSVAIAGVFLVFSYLVIPAVGAMLLAERLSKRLTIGWIGGAVCSFVGVKLSWDTGLPTSPLVVCVLAFALLTAGLVRFIRTAERKSQAIRFVLQSLLVIAVFVSGLLFFGKDKEDPLKHHLEMLESPSGTDRVTAISQLAGFAAQKNVWMDKVVSRLGDSDAQVRKAAIEILVSIPDTVILRHIPALLRDQSDAVKTAAVLAVRKLGNAEHANELVEAAGGEEDPELLISMTRTAIDLGNPGGIPVLAALVSRGGFFADEAYSIIASHLEARFEKRQMDSLVRWYKENEGRLHWDAEQHKFIVRRQ